MKVVRNYMLILSGVFKSGRSEAIRYRRCTALVSIFLGMLFFCGGTVYANNVSSVSLTAEMQRYDLSANMLHFEDQKGVLSFSDIYQDKLAIPWQKSPSSLQSFGFSRSVFWFYAKINTSSEDLQWYINIDNPQIRELDLYIVENGKVLKVYQTGDRFEFSGRPLEYRSFLFPFDVRVGQSLDVFLRIKSPYPIRVPVAVVERTSFLQSAVQKELAYGLLFGFFGVMAAYNFFIFFVTREFGYLFYVLFTISSAFFISAELGFSFQYLWPSSIYWQHKAVGISASFVLLFAGLFVSEFLRLRTLNRNLYLLMVVVVSYSLFTICIGGFIDAFYLQQVGSIAALLGSIVALVSGCLAWKNGKKEARYFVVAWLLYILGVGVFVAYRLGYLPGLFLTRYSMEIGAALELVLLSFALADKLMRKRSRRETLNLKARHVKEKVLADQKNALEQERVSNERLAKNIKKRTERLHQALAELSIMNHKLEEMSTVDAVTGLKNQSSFVNRLQEEWERAYRDQTAVAILLVSIERFDAIGDCYGYVAADESLKVIGQILHSLVTRPADLLARVEVALFGAVLPNTEQEGIEHLIKEINTKIKAEPINLGVCCISVSVKCVYSVVVPQKSGGSEQLLIEARQQL